MGTQPTPAIMERLTRPALAWSARFPFVARADDVCTQQDNSIGITPHTSCTQDLSLMKDRGNIDILCNLLSASAHRGIKTP